VALACREDVAVAVALIGLILLAERRWRVGAATIGVAVAGYAVSSFAQHAANPDGLAVLASRYGYLGSTLGSALSNALLHPVTAFAPIDVPLNAGILAVGLLLPAIPLFFARWTRLLAAFPFIVLNLLSSSAQQRSIYFHYGFLVSVFVFIAVADGVPRMMERRPPVRRAMIAGSAIALLVAVPFTSPFFDSGYRGPGAWPRPATIQDQLRYTFPAGFKQQADAGLALVGQGSVSVSANLLPQLADRAHVYMLPNPFFPAWYGDYLTRDADASVRPTWPADPPRWVVVDRIHFGPEPVSDRKLLLAMLPERYHLIYQTDDIQVWEKT
jgi:uncharacterized membrane protein